MKEDLKKIFITFFIILSIVTQNYARQIGYPRSFGNPLLIIGSYKIYSPHKFIFIDENLKFQTIKTYNTNKMIIVFSLLLVTYLMSYYLKKNKTAYGTARWATKKDLKTQNLYTGKGVVLGKFKGKIMSHTGPEHIMMMAPTRMGKGVNTVIPTLFSWEHSVIVNDIKGECFELTSGFRNEILGQKIIMFNPLDEEGNSFKFNPLDEIRLKTKNELEDIKVISQTLIDVDGKGSSDHWVSSAINLLTGVILHIKYAKENANLTDVINFMTNPDMEISDVMGLVIGLSTNDEGDIIETEKFNHIENPKLFEEIYGEKTTTHPIVASIFSQMYNTPSKERGSIISTATNKLAIFLDPKIKENTSYSDFKIKELKDEKITLYLVTPPRGIEMTKPLTRLIYTQTIYGLTGVMKFNNKKETKIEKLKKEVKKNIENFFFKQKEKNKLLFLIDEFPSLGNMSIFETAMAYIAGYGLKVLLITQSVNQLNKIYGKDNSIMDNCHIQMYMTPNDNETPKKISELLGNYTEEIKNSSYKIGEFKKNISTSLISRPLMTVGEVSTLPYEKLIIRIAGKYAILSEKIFYFKEKKFKDLVNFSPVYNKKTK